MPPARLVILLAAVALLVSTSQNTVALPTLFDADPPLCSHQGVTCESDQVVAVQLGRQNRWPTEMSWGRAIDGVLRADPSGGPSSSRLLLPDEAVWDRLSALRELHLAGAALTGTLPTELGLLTSLTSLKLGYNALVGTIPTQLGDLSSLQRLALEFNNLTGTLPSRLGGLTALTSVALQANRLTGTVPAEFSSWRRVRVLLLSDNRLRGRLDFLPPLLSLRRVYLTFNAFSGPLPSELSRLSHLAVLDADDNRLSGTLPSSTDFWHGLRSLHVLNVDDNRLGGSIPSEIATLGSGGLVSLELSDNRLSGTLPTELAALPTAILSVYGNARLTGIVPPGVQLSTKWFSTRFWTGERTTATAGTALIIANSTV